MQFRGVLLCMSSLWSLMVVACRYFMRQKIWNQIHHGEHANLQCGEHTNTMTCKSKSISHTLHESADYLMHPSTLPNPSPFSLRYWIHNKVRAMFLGCRKALHLPAGRLGTNQIHSQIKIIRLLSPHHGSVFEGVMWLGVDRVAQRSVYSLRRVALAKGKE